MYANVANKEKVGMKSLIKGNIYFDVNPLVRYDDDLKRLFSDLIVLIKRGNGWLLN